MKNFLAKFATSPTSLIPSSSPSKQSPLSVSPPRSLHPREDSMDSDQLDVNEAEKTKPLTLRSKSPSPSIHPKQVEKIFSKLEQIILPTNRSKTQNLINLLDTYTYTLKCTEVAYRGKFNKTGNYFFESLSKQEMLVITTVSNLIEALAAPLDSSSRAFIKQTSWSLLRKIIWCMVSEDEFPGFPSDPSSKGGVLLEDAIANLVQMICVSPPSSLSDARNFIRLFFMIEIVKTILGLVMSPHIPKLKAERTFTDEERSVLELVFFIQSNALHVDSNIEIPDPTFFLRELKVRLLPFLRQASLILFAHLNVKCPNEDDDMESSEYNKLCSYLGLSNSIQFVINPSDPTHYKLISGWCSAWATSDRKLSENSLSVQNISFSPLLQKVMPIYLTPLPNQYESLLIQSCRAQCPKNGAIRVNPALCLLCGQYNCCQSACCSSERGGACASHAKDCHGATGLFLLDKQCIIFVFQEGKGAFNLAPYFDNHGEPDPGLRRGRPLTFHPKRYEQLRDLFVTHRIMSLLTPQLDRGHQNEAWEGL